MYGENNAKFSSSNLDQAVSPYLRQHKDNPIHWQERGEEVLRYAEESVRILFVSVGYSSCRWCHVIAGEAFSDPGCAAYLNSRFASEKN